MFELTYIKAVNASLLGREVASTSCGSKYLHVTTSGNNVSVGFSEQLTAPEIAEVDAIVAAHSYNPTSDIVKKTLNNAIEFGTRLLLDFATENILLGITQSGKTGAVTLYLHKLGHYISTGSLYEALNEIDALVAAGVDVTLAPFVTEARLLSYKTQIQEYLGV